MAFKPLVVNQPCPQGAFPRLWRWGEAMEKHPGDEVVVKLIKAVCHIVFPQIRAYTLINALPLVSIHWLGPPSGSPLQHSCDSLIIKNILILIYLLKRLDSL